MPPENTFDIVYIYSDGSIAIPTWGKGVAKVDNLQAVELPPHGDLIEMDKLYKTMETYTDYGGATEPHDENQIHRDSILFAIENAPVVVPAERSGVYG